MQNAEIKVADRLKQFSSAWENITSDEYILDEVKGYEIKFVDSAVPCHNTLTAGNQF